MDLRIKKTKRAIRTAFYELIKEKPLEKITVTEIAARAEINKATFTRTVMRRFMILLTSWSRRPLPKSSANSTPYRAC